MGGAFRAQAHRSGVFVAAARVGHEVVFALLDLISYTSSGPRGKTYCEHEHGEGLHSAMFTLRSAWVSGLTFFF
jgi:hypothetical protein